MKKSFLKDQRGATLAYVAVLLTVMMGVVGLSFDLGRHYILSTELQKAADAAAIAGAYQLNPNGVPADTLARVQAAVQNAPVTGNQTKLAASDGIVNIPTANIRLLQTIPGDDDEAIGSVHNGPPYNLVSVTTEAKTSNNIFGRIVGQPADVTMTATAVARRGRAVCQITPLAICNPAEDNSSNIGADFDVNDYLGTQILVRAIGSGNQAWEPGFFGFLNSPGFGNGAPGLYDSLATSEPENCFNVTVTTEPGQTNGARSALNTRFGIYTGPAPGGSTPSEDYPPAENVRSGWNTNRTPAQHCAAPVRDANLLKRLPRDTDLSDTNRFGNGEWDCAGYWVASHPSTEPMPTGCAGPSSNTVTRWEVYRYEINNNYQNSTGASPPGPLNSAYEVAKPICNNQASNPPYVADPNDLTTDRRVVTMAVLNCYENSVRGRWTGPTEGFINGFLTEPVLGTGDIVFEVIGGSNPGAGGPVAVKIRDWVEIVR